MGTGLSPEEVPVLLLLCDNSDEGQGQLFVMGLLEKLTASYLCMQTRASLLASSNRDEMSTDYTSNTRRISPPLVVRNMMKLKCFFLSPLITPFVGVCIGKHQNCLEYGAQKEFSCINRKIIPIANWYLMLHQWTSGDVCAVQSVLPYHRPLFQHPLPGAELFSAAQCSWVLPTTKGSELQAPWSSRSQSPCWACENVKVGWHPTSDGDHNWCLHVQTGRERQIPPKSLKVICWVYALKHSDGYPFSVPISSDNKHGFFDPFICLQDHSIITFNTYPQGLSLRL